MTTLTKIQVIKSLRNTYRIQYPTVWITISEAALVYENLKDRLNS